MFLLSFIPVQNLRDFLLDAYNVCYMWCMLESDLVMKEDRLCSLIPHSINRSGVVLGTGGGEGKTIRTSIPSDLSSDWTFVVSHLSHFLIKCSSSSSSCCCS